MMTEDEAKEKWCPFSRPVTVVGEDNHDKSPVIFMGNRVLVSIVGDDPQEAMFNENPDGSRCIGSRCMAWRWARGFNPTSGYCGLAGKPHGAPE